MLTKTQPTFAEIQSERNFNPRNRPMPRKGQSMLDFAIDRLSNGEKLPL